MGTWSDRPRWARTVFTVLDVAIVLALLAIGLRLFALALFAPGFSFIPGDLGDARLNNYVLEHFHQWTLGKVPRYWDAPFLYPHGNAMAFSENLLGTAPLYTLIRRIGFDREGAFQLWIVGLFVANYIGCWLALWKWTRHAIVAACGAFIFAFGIHLLDDLSHLQTLPRWITPLAFWWCWHWLRTKRVKPLVWLTGAVVYQFYCSLALGFFLLYGLFFLTLAYALVYRREAWAGFPVRRDRLVQAAVTVGGILVLLPLITHYGAARSDVMLRPWPTVLERTPRLNAYFISHPGALSWRSLVDAGPEAPIASRFLGALPWVAILFVPLLLMRKSAGGEPRKQLSVVLLALVLCVLFAVRFGDFALYRAIAVIPFFAELAPVGAFPVQAMLFVLVFALVFTALLRSSKYLWPLVLILPALVVLDDRISSDKTARFDKYTAQRETDQVVRDVAHATKVEGQAFAYLPTLPFDNPEHTQEHRRDAHVHAMFAAQQLGRPTVNGYVARYPTDFKMRYDLADQQWLDFWCRDVGGAAHVQQIDNIGLPVLRRDTVTIRTAEGRYVCADQGRNGLALADRESAHTWEVFIRLQLTDSTCAFLASNERFLCAELAQELEISATAARLGDFGIFRIVPQADGNVAIKCDNGRYVSVDPNSHEMHATAEAVGPRELFVIGRHRPR